MLATRSELFLDASYAIALASPADRYHAQASALAERLEAEHIPLVTTRAVMLEVGNALAKQRYRADAVALLDAIERDPTIEVVPFSESLYAHAFRLYRDRLDKGWGLTDCASFVLMRERGITDALTADGHFQQAGFRALLTNV